LVLVLSAVIYGKRSQSTSTGVDNVSPVAGSRATSEPEHRLHVDRVRSFATLGEVRAVSSAIVKVTTGDQSSGKIGGMPITVTQATVTKVVWGEIASGSDIELRQLGFPGVVGNMSKIIESGKEYLVFLVPSTGADDAAPNRYLVAGDVGLYELQGDRYVLRGGDVPPEGRSTLPANLDAATAEVSVTS
jgi:hypothetical protein